MKIVETNRPVIRIAECDEVLTIEMIDNPSPDGPKITYRDLALRPSTDLAGRPCWSAYDRATDTLYVRWVS